jgi:hypothetical protein
MAGSNCFASRYRFKVCCVFSDPLRCEFLPKGVRLSLVSRHTIHQLAWENSIKPPELKALETLAGILSPDEVAGSLRDVPEAAISLSRNEKSCYFVLTWPVPSYPIPIGGPVTKRKVQID